MGPGHHLFPLPGGGWQDNVAEMEKLEVVMPKIPGKTAHDAYCSEDDFHALDEETVALWVTVEDDVLAAYGGSR